MTHTIDERIAELKKQRDAVVLAHFYVPSEVQAIADYVGDSFYLSKLAASLPNKTIVFAGVEFMGESAKLLSPEKTVYLPEPCADCPMAHKRYRFCTYHVSRFSGSLLCKLHCRN